MKEIPFKIMNLLIAIQDSSKEMNALNAELKTVLGKYGVSDELFANISKDSNQKNPLECIKNDENNIRYNIKYFQEIFLDYMNRKNQDDNIAIKIKIIKYGDRISPGCEEIGEISLCREMIGRNSDDEEMCIDIDDIRKFMNRE